MSRSNLVPLPLLCLWPQFHGALRHWWGSSAHRARSRRRTSDQAIHSQGCRATTTPMGTHLKPHQPSQGSQPTGHRWLVISIHYLFSNNPAFTLHHIVDLLLFWGLMYKACLHTKKLRKLTTSHANVQMYKDCLDVRKCGSPRKRNAWLTHISAIQLAAQRGNAVQH